MQGLIRAPAMLLAVGLLLASSVAVADGFRVRRVETRLVEDVYYLDAHVDIALSGAALEALEHGVPISIVFEMRVLRELPYWPDERVADLTQRFRLEYHALSKRNVLVNVNTGASQTFDSLDEALGALGTIQDFPLIDRSLIKAGERYEGDLKARLDIEGLPAPMRPLAYLSSEWRLSSDRRVWLLQP